MARLAGLLVCCAWYYTILCGFFVLYCPVLYLMFINQSVYRKVADTLFSLWELYPVALFQCCCNTKVNHYGDYVDRDENTIVIMNHRTRVDWNYVWMGLYHATQAKPNEGRDEDDTNSVQMINNKKNSVASMSIHELGRRAKIKFVLKDELKSVPGLGWIMQLNFFLYVKRDWREDQLSLARFVDYYRRTGAGYRLVLFPEGTDLSEENRRRSDRYAVVNSLPHLEFLLHPRTTGWAALCSQLRAAGLASVYDATVAYEQPAQTEADLLAGRLPGTVHFHFKRYSIDQLPCDEDDLRIWLNDKWREKELSLRMFHDRGHFLDGESEGPVLRTPRSLSTAKFGFVFWTLVDLLFTYAVFSSMLFQFWVIYHSILFVFVTWKFGGFQNIQYLLLDKLKSGA